MKRIAFLWFVTAAVVTGFCLSATGQDEYWDPAGAPRTDAGKMKTLEQLEPRTPIVSLPFTISNPGSYYLIHSLNGVAGSNGIIIAAGEVQLDMNGFALFGGSNTADGIYVKPFEGPGPPGGRQFSISIHNGSVIEWDGWGINATNADQSEFINLKVMMNGNGGIGGGIGAGGSCQLVQCSAGNNKGHGITTDFDGTITDCKSFNNTGVGIRAGDGSRISGCTAANNGSDGFQTQAATTVSDCKAHMNTSNGIVLGGGSHLVASTTAKNSVDGIVIVAGGFGYDAYCTIQDCSVIQNSGNGIKVGASCRVEYNNIGDNGKSGSGAGILVTGPGNRIKDNNITANARGIVVQNQSKGNWIESNGVIDNQTGIQIDGVGNFVIRNAVGNPLETNNPVYFQITNNNCCAQILTNLVAGFTNSNPWANIQTTD